MLAGRLKMGDAMLRAERDLAEGRLIDRQGYNGILKLNNKIDLQDRPGRTGSPKKRRGGDDEDLPGARNCPHHPR